MKKLWLGFAAVIIISFSVLGWIGTRIYQEMPPIPDKVVTTAGDVVVPSGAIGRGQNVWQSMGGMEVGSVWGHGSYVAPDWTADWLHREATFVLDELARQQFGMPYEKLGVEQQAGLRGRLQQMYRSNNYDAADHTLRIDPVRARAFNACLAHYSDVFMKGDAAYAIPAGAIRDANRMSEFAAFIFWTAWAAAADRPGDTVSYTHNWPPDPLVGNRPTGESVMWTGVSIHHAAGRHLRHGVVVRGAETRSGSRRAARGRPAGKLAGDAFATRHAEILLGGGAADPGADRGWESSPPTTAWRATASTASRLQSGCPTRSPAPGTSNSASSGSPPPGWPPACSSDRWYPASSRTVQRLGVNVLFVALLVVVGGSLTGEWMSIQNKLSDAASFLWGHQGYEYVDLGRGWQALLFVGLLIWLFLVVRADPPGAQSNRANSDICCGCF